MESIIRKNVNSEELVEVLGYPVTRKNISWIEIDKQNHFLINTISPNSYGLAQKDKVAEEALKNSDLLILDGVYFGWASIIINGIKINRITGWDAFIHFSEWANQNKKKVFFLGSSLETLQKIKLRFEKEFPNCQVGFYSPPFKNEFSIEDNLEMHKAINDFDTDILFVGMTAPKQEKWGYANKNELNVKIICTIGNVFDWYAGNSKRPSVFWQKTGLEWLVRIFYRPEIFRRNIKNQMLFFWHLFLIIIKVR